jgi:hypothetical protein
MMMITMAAAETMVAVVVMAAAVAMHQMATHLSKLTHPQLDLIVLSVAVTRKKSRKLDRIMKRPMKRLTGLISLLLNPGSGYGYEVMRYVTSQQRVVFKRVLQNLYSSAYN